MNITSAQYTSSQQHIIKATIDEQEMFIPVSQGNRHYQAIQAWVAEGNTIEEAD